MSNEFISQLEKYHLKLISFDKQFKYSRLIKKLCNSYRYIDIV